MKDQCASGYQPSRDLLIATSQVYEPCGLVCSALEVEAESAEYCALTFQLNSLRIKYREAKITPTKTGQFVTLWKRTGNGPIQPLEVSDLWDVLIISTRSGEKLGQFVFPKPVLLSKGVISGNGREGKRGIRVYPPWDTVTSKQAQKTQQWQADYFVYMGPGSIIDINLVQQLFSGSYTHKASSSIQYPVVH